MKFAMGLKKNTHWCDNSKSHNNCNFEELVKGKWYFEVPAKHVWYKNICNLYWWQHHRHCWYNYVLLLMVIIEGNSKFHLEDPENNDGELLSFSGA